MTLYSIALFVHMLGFIALFAALAMQQRAGFNLRRGDDPAQARFWLGLLAATSTMIPAGSIMLLVSGIAMTAISWTSGPVWVAASAVGLVVMAVIYLAVIARRFRAMRAAMDAAGESPSGLAAMWRAAGPVWTWLWTINGGALATIWLMVAKPGAAASIGTLAGGMLLGALLGFIMSRPRGDGRPELAGL